jgi:hypothetical protein
MLYSTRIITVKKKMHGFQNFFKNSLFRSAIYQSKSVAEQFTAEIFLHLAAMPVEKL